jgi:multidrug efflux system membrane fusion protein
MFAAIAGCNKGSDQQQAAAPAPMMATQVTATDAIARDVPIYLDEIGRTIPVESVTIVPQVAGKILSTNVTDGMSVKKGDLLFEIDPAPFEATLSAAQATLQQYKAELELAKVEFKRMSNLVATSAVSPLEYDQKKSALAVSEGKIAWAESQIQKAKVDLNYTKIYSPIDGRAGARLVDAGNVVKANEGSLLVIQRLNPIYAEFTITENDLGTVRKFIAAKGLDLGDRPEVGLKALVDVPGNSAKVIEALGNPAPTTQPGKSHVGQREGSLTFMDNMVQNATGTVKLRATLPNADGYFWPGQFVNVRLVLTTKKDAVLIPAAAQQIGQQGPYVYVVTEGEVENPVDKSKTKATIAQLRPIVPGQKQGDMMVVEQGVKAGEKIVVTGQLMIMPGGPVMVVNPPPAPAGKNVASAQ